MQKLEPSARPISPQQMASAAIRFGDVAWSRDGRYLIWHESRGGLGVLAACDPASDDAPFDLSPAELSVRGRVGYGGGEFCVGRTDVFFAADAGRLYRMPLAGGAAVPITPGFGVSAAPALSPDEAWLVFVHSYEGHDCLAIVSSDGAQWPQRLLHGYDFVMQPCWHPDGNHLAVVVWNHPNMPWDGSELLLLSLESTGGAPRLRTTQVLAGDATTAIFQPAFSPDGRWLAYVSDASGWGRIMLHDLQSGETHCLTAVEAEHGQPAWIQGMRTFAWSRDSARIYYVRNQLGRREVLVQPVLGGEAHSLSADLEYSWFEQPAAAPHTDALAGIASSSLHPPRVMFSDSTRNRIVRRSAPDPRPTTLLAQAQHRTWQSSDSSLHGLLYQPPHAPAGTRLPTIIRLHGGPSDQAHSGYQSDVQFFVSRGYVVFDLNYRGSTGYGRAYLDSLREGWGEFDVLDTLSAADYLVEAGIADPKRLVVMGSSAGGLTALLALCRMPGRFRAAICRYPVVDLAALTEETHKFEARYLDGLVGPLPEFRARYAARSPINLVEQIRDVVAIFQGADDPVVPPVQVEQMAQALRRRNVPLEYRVFAGEGHGFRKPETISAYYSAIEVFLRRYLA